MRSSKEVKGDIDLAMIQQLRVDEARKAHSREWSARETAALNGPRFNRIELEREYTLAKMAEAEEERKLKGK